MCQWYCIVKGLHRCVSGCALILTLRHTRTESRIDSKGPAMEWVIISLTAGEDNNSVNSWFAMAQCVERGQIDVIMAIHQSGKGWSDTDESLAHQLGLFVWGKPCRQVNHWTESVLDVSSSGTEPVSGWNALLESHWGSTAAACVRLVMKTGTSANTVMKSRA